MSGPLSGALYVIALEGMGEIRAGDDLAAAVLEACRRGGTTLLDDDVLAVASKVVAKAEGRLVAADREAVVAAQTAAVVAHRSTPRGRTVIARSTSGPVLAAAGVDASNVPDGYVLPLPVDPDASARRLRAALGEATGLRLGVLVTDTLGRPWREGQVDAAIGAAGVDVVDDLRGRADREGRVMDVTVRAVADEIAAAADLVKQKVRGAPVAVVRGLGRLRDDDGPGAGSLVRHGDQDWFRWGSLEAVEVALGHRVGDVDAAPAGVVPWGEAVRRSLLLARVPPGRHGDPGAVVADPAAEVVEVGAEHVELAPAVGITPVAFALLVERLLTALAAHGYPCAARWDESRVMIRTGDAEAIGART